MFSHAIKLNVFKFLLLQNTFINFDWHVKYNEFMNIVIKNAKFYFILINSGLNKVIR